MEKRIEKLIEDTVNNLGFNIVKIAVHGSLRKIIRIYIENFDLSSADIEDCRRVSRHISTMLDVEDIVAGKYSLEVSSAGLERPLTKKYDFVRYFDRDVTIKLREPHNGNFAFKGKLNGMEGDKVKLKSKKVDLLFDFNNIKQANLVFTDKMFRQLLNKKTNM